MRWNSRSLPNRGIIVRGQAQPLRRPAALAIASERRVFSAKSPPSAWSLFLESHNDFLFPSLSLSLSLSLARARGEPPRFSFSRALGSARLVFDQREATSQRMRFEETRQRGACVSTEYFQRERHTLCCCVASCRVSQVLPSRRRALVRERERGSALVTLAGASCETRTRACTPTAWTGTRSGS